MIKKTRYVMEDFNYRIGSNTHIIGRPPRFYHNSELLQAGCRFASVYSVRHSDAESISLSSKTAAGFRGIVWSARLWVDFDEEEAATRAIQYLKENDYGFTVYTTGNRGCHIGINRDANPSHTLPAQDKAWVKEHLPGADLSLYWHLHLIRLPGAIHETTGRRKEVREETVGKAIRLPEYTPDVQNSPEEVHSSEESGERPPLFTVWKVVSNLSGGTPNGGRHEQLFNLSIGFKESGVGFERTVWLVQEVNRSFIEPKSIEEVYRIVKWVYEETNKGPR